MPEKNWRSDSPKKCFPRLRGCSIA